MEPRKAYLSNTPVKWGYSLGSTEVIEMACILIQTLSLRSVYIFNNKYYMLYSEVEQIYVKTQTNGVSKMLEVTHLWKLFVRESFVLSISWISKNMLTQYIRRNSEKFEIYKEKWIKYISINIFLYVWKNYQRLSRCKIQ